MTVMTGGAPPPPAVLFRMEELGFLVIHSYGLTETYGPATVCTWKPEWDALPAAERADPPAGAAARANPASGSAAATAGGVGRGGRGWRAASARGPEEEVAWGAAAGPAGGAQVRPAGGLPCDDDGEEERSMTMTCGAHETV